MSWIYNGAEIVTPPEEFVGFVYLITNLTNNRKYIGKKLLTFKKTRFKTIKLKNGKKKRQKIKGTTPSNWQNYYGSSKELLLDIEKLGTEQFKREILYFCKSKAECSYIEAKLQFEHKVLESADYYNNYIMVRLHGSHIIKK